MRSSPTSAPALFISTILLGLTTDAVLSQELKVVEKRNLALQETSEPDSSEELDALLKRFRERQIIRGSRQWACSKDMNSDGQFTVGDVGLWIPCVFFYPGDFLIYILLLENPSKATVFKLTPESYGGTFSFVASFVVWVWVVFGSLFLLLMALLFRDWWKNRKLRKKGNNDPYDY